MVFLEAYYFLQGINMVLACLFNGFLVYLVQFHTQNKIGFYKWILISYAIFGAFYAAATFVGMPIHFMAERSWLVFTHGGLIGETPFAVIGPGLYCTLYEIWVGFIVIQFVYRYFIVCKEDWVSKIEQSKLIKLFITIGCLIFVVFTILCGFYFCTRENITESLAKKVKDQFGIEEPIAMGYILLRTKTESGNYSIAGLTTIINHYVLVSISFVIIIFCGIRIYRKITKMRQEHQGGADLRVQRQMFRSLLVQTMVPIIFCHIPTTIYLTFPFWENDFSFGSLSPLFSLLTSINKFVDPLIVIYCIREYRRAAIIALCGKSSVQVTSITSTTNFAFTLAVQTSNSQ